MKARKRKPGRRPVRRIIVAEGYAPVGEKALQDLRFDLESAWVDQPLISSDDQPKLNPPYSQAVHLVLEVLPPRRTR